VTAPKERLLTSQLFQAIVADIENKTVTLAWLSAGLRERSFGMILLLLGMIAMLPGVGVVAGVVLLAIGFQMIRAYEAPHLPTLIAHKPLPASNVSRLLVRAIPIMRALERFIRPRWHTPFVATKRLIGLTISSLAVTLFIPIPLSNIIPGALTMLIAFAYLEEDGALLCGALAASVVSLGLTGTEAWAALHGANLLLRG
jgi:hypothetical protein